MTDTTRDGPARPASREAGTSRSGPVAVPAAPTAAAGAPADSQWPLWEVFVQPGHGAPHEHAGSVHAVDAEHALLNARDVYGRRQEGISIWVVPAAAITASTPDDVGPFFDPANDKPYRHPQFYKVPTGVRVF
jgi:ring-1,2-phenylacetyl-CoA epoxidase subunit PaaB